MEIKDHAMIWSFALLKSKRFDCGPLLGSACDRDRALLEELRRVIAGPETSHDWLAVVDRSRRLLAIVAATGAVEDATLVAWKMRMLRAACMGDGPTVQWGLDLMTSEVYRHLISIQSLDWDTALACKGRSERPLQGFVHDLHFQPTATAQAGIDAFVFE